MHRIIFAVSTALILVVAGSSLARAQSSNAIFTADQEACFGRVYDRDHLASHPRQKATSVHVYRWLARRPQAENWYPEETAEGIKRFHEDGRANVEAYVAFRDRRGTYY